MENQNTMVGAQAAQEFPKSARLLETYDFLVDARARGAEEAVSDWLGILSVEDRWTLTQAIGARMFERAEALRREQRNQKEGV